MNLIKQIYSWLQNEVKMYVDDVCERLPSPTNKAVSLYPFIKKLLVSLNYVERKVRNQNNERIQRINKKSHIEDKNALQ